MKRITLFVFTVSLSLAGFTQPLLNEPLRIPDLEGSLNVLFDTVNAKKGKLSFVYKMNDVTIIATDSLFTDIFSEREFIVSLNSQKDSLVAKLKRASRKDSSLVKTGLPILINQLSNGWYLKANLTKKQEGMQAKFFPGGFKFAYNDSLKAGIVPMCSLKIYKAFKNANDKDSNVYFLNIPIRRAALQISDGFIYAFNFDIDPTNIPDTLRQQIQSHQAFSIRYNLRHNLLAKGMLSNQRAINLKKDNTWYRTRKTETGYVFYIKDFVDYLPPVGASNTIFTAKDTILNIVSCDGQAKQDTLFVKEKSLYSIINLDVFGDLVGFFNQDNPNGLIQSELKAQFYGFRRPVSQKSAFRSRFTFLNKGEVFFRFSKIDNKNRFLDVLQDSVRRQPAQTDTSERYVHGYRLLEYQNIQAGVRMNLGEFEYRGGSLAFTSELSFLRTPLRDTIFTTTVKDNRVDTILSPVSFGKNSLIFAPGVNLKIYASSFLDIDLRSRMIFIFPLTKRINLSKSEYDDFYGTNSLVKTATTRLVNLGGHVTINLNSDKTRRFILRGENYIDLNQKGNNFWQAQVGYSADLNKFLKIGD